MSYTKEQIYNEAIDLITKNHNICFFSDLFTLTSYGKDVFYRKIDKKSEKYEDIKKALTGNKNRTKQLLRQKWFESKQPTLQLALYKLIANQQEFNRIASNNIDLTTKGESINVLNLGTGKNPENGTS